MEAADEQALYQALRADGLFVIKYTLSEKEKRRLKLKDMQIGDFCRNLGTLLGAGVSLARALSIVSQSEDLKKEVAEIYRALLNDVRAGVALSTAMDNQQPTFPELLCNMVRSAEASGNMDKVMLRMADFFEKQHKLKKRVSGAMTYPIMLLVMLIIVVIALVTFIMPQFEGIFSKMGELPGITQFMLDLSDAFRNDWVLILIAVAFIATAFMILKRVPAIRYQMDKLKVKLPVFGKLMRTIYTARFARTLSSLYSSGLPIIRSLTIGSRTLGNMYIERQFDSVIEQVREGGALSRALMGVEGFTRRLGDAAMIGEETGNLDSMLESTADALEYDSEMAINKMVGMIEPAMIIMMAGVVGTVIVAVILPVLQYYQSIETVTYE